MRAGGGAQATDGVVGRVRGRREKKIKLTVTNTAMGRDSKRDTERETSRDR